MHLQTSYSLHPLLGTAWESYSTGHKKGFSYLVGNLVATNWPIEKALHAIGCNQIRTK